MGPTQTTAAVRTELSPKRVRALVAGVAVADSRRAVLVWEKPHYPTYYLPRDDVRGELVEVGPVDRTEGDEPLGQGVLHDLRLEDQTVRGAVATYPDASGDALSGLVRIDWGAADQWLEEDEPVFVHPRDPYKRVDILASSRHVRIELDGVTIADSRQPRILFETGLIARYYLPITDVRGDLLRDSATITHCPYKGAATWWSVQVGDALHTDVAWTYPAPLAESLKVAGLVCLSDERVDMWLDDVPQPRPVSPFT
ncbi:MAG: DUF427 domain-containing protein [Actinomycetota bacterium]|nr:DUF427 domain-containing protein [Actinomycetota bacterium]MDQ3432799.1 DUF427 domain-containing protein [Actinomycetota bacterium]